MALFGKDWNVLTLTFERADLLRVNGNRTKGLDANKIRDNAMRHARSVYWAVFDQRGKVLKSEAGPGIDLISKSAAERLKQDWVKHESVQAVLEMLQKGEVKAARIYPASDFAAPAAAPPTKADRTYKLVVDAGEGDEFESTLKLIQSIEGLFGTLISPDGDEVPIRDAQLTAGQISFEFTLGSGEEAVSLRFRGLVRRDVVKGSFV
ncbi:MAG TPA: hypothetical protein VHC22_25175 [Pirellulales bacterium]|nr:hypothetical protein [Pirellulales bacterium]